MVKSGRMKWAPHVALMGRTRNAYKILVGISEERRLLRRPKRKRKDNLKINFREIVLYGVDLVNQDRDMQAFVNTVSYCHRSIKR
jgi:hypothetical protein